MWISSCSSTVCWKDSLCSIVLSSVGSNSVTLWTVTLPGSSVHRILQETTLEWLAMPFPRGSCRLRDRTHVSGIACIARRVLSHWCRLGSPLLPLRPRQRSGDCLCGSIPGLSRLFYWSDDGQESFMCHSPWGCKAWDMTEQVNWTDKLSNQYVNTYKTTHWDFDWRLYWLYGSGWKEHLDSTESFLSCNLIRLTY